MTIILVGLNHRTAPVELREKLALNGCALPMALEELWKKRQGAEAHPVVQEAVILSTCNRLEIYAVVENRDAGWQYIEQFLCDLQNISQIELHPHLYMQEGAAGIQHLMRVACGLDSMILGEPQILGQVTQAFEDAKSAGMTGATLSRVFTQSIHAGKRARTETDISKFTTSVSSAGAQMVLENVTTTDPNILVVGAGEMAILAAKALQKQGIQNLTFINRTYSRAANLAEEVGGTSMGWHQLAEGLAWADAIITATGAPHMVIYANEVQTVMRNRDDRPLLLVDIAVPRDVDIAAGELPGVRRFDIDDLQSIVDSNTAQREAAIPQIETLIEQELSFFLEWHHSREVTPVIRDLRKWATDVAEIEVQQALSKLPEDDEQVAAIVNRLAHRIVNKLLHEPTVRLRGQAVEGNGHGYAHAVSELFGLHTVQCSVLDNTCESENTLPQTSCNLQCIFPAEGHRHEH
ncbi:MAG: glutamyl-tRNA reductase [Anaerolineae bacterium]|nr:glutamyl-tRNA reductase [Anaerolineae bacterium]